MPSSTGWLGGMEGGVRLTLGLAALDLVAAHAPDLVLGHVALRGLSSALMQRCDELLGGTAQARGRSPMTWASPDALHGTAGAAVPRAWRSLASACSWALSAS